MEAAKQEREEGPCCPICLEPFNIPKELPCAHTFCEKCLQSHIIAEATKHKELRYVQCPVCTTNTSPPIKDRPTSEWASLFPANTILQAVLTTKSKLHRVCEACNSESVSVPAEGFCAVCKEAMCGDCSKVHRKQKISKDHIILSVEELACNPTSVMEFAEGFTCSEHDGEDIKYYCKDHKVSCCGACFLYDHKNCSKVIILTDELPDLLRESMPEEITADMKKIEIHLKTFMEMNEIYVNNLDSQVNSLTDQIREVRTKINLVLDELEKRVKTEGNRICKEEVIRKQDENHQCLSLVHAVRNSHYLLEAVQKYGTNLQTFLMAEKMRSQLHSYLNMVREMYEKNDMVTLAVEFAPSIQSILSLSLSELGAIVTTVSSSTFRLACLRRLTKDCQVEKVDVVDLKIPNGKLNLPYYSGVTFLSGDRVMLADAENAQCILLRSSYQFITSHRLTGKPWNICVLNDEEVAVSLYNQNKIQILSVLNDIIVPVRMIETKYWCNGIASAGKGDIVVHGYCGNSTCHWSMISTSGEVKYSHQYDCQSRYYKHYVALNNMKTRVYVTMYSMNSLLCFDMNGREQFKYSPDNLRGPRGVAVDRHDNIYVLGYKPDYIHQLSSDGSILQVITSAVPERALAICLHKSKDILIITNESDRTKLHIYELKYN